MHKSGIHHLPDVVRTLPENFKTDSNDTNKFWDIPLYFSSNVSYTVHATYCSFVQHVNSFPFVNHHVFLDTFMDVLVDFDNSY